MRYIRYTGVTAGVYCLACSACNACSGLFRGGGQVAQPSVVQVSPAVPFHNNICDAEVAGPDAVGCQTTCKSTLVQGLASNIAPWGF